MNISHRHCHMSDYIEANVANNVALRGISQVKTEGLDQADHSWQSDK